MASSQQAPDMLGVRAILFDFDGTLMLQSIDFAQMRSDVLQLADAYGVCVDDDLARMPALEIVEAVAHRLGAADGERAIAFRRKAVQAIEAIEMAAASVAAPYPDVPTALETLACRGYAIGIVTRNCRRAVSDLLARHALTHDALVTRDDVDHVKPDARHLYKAAQGLGISIGRCLMCGDHPMDIAAGRAAGAWTAAVVYKDAAIGRDAFVGSYTPDFVFANISQLVAHMLGSFSDGARADDEGEAFQDA